MKEHQIDKLGKVCPRNILRSLYMKLYLIWSAGVREMALDKGRTDGRTGSCNYVLALKGT